MPYRNKCDVALLEPGVVLCFGESLFCQCGAAGTKVAEQMSGPELRLPRLGAGVQSPEGPLCA